MKYKILNLKNVDILFCFFCFFLALASEKVGREIFFSQVVSLLLVM